MDAAIGRYPDRTAFRSFSNVLSYGEFDAKDRAADDYVCVRKLHTYSGEPFCYAEIYVPTPVFEALPKDVARKRKLLAGCSTNWVGAASACGNARP
jgi:hypothetical protein